MALRFSDAWAQSNFKVVCPHRRTVDGYESVKKWTKNMDIFDKKWIVVPINE